MKQPLPIKSSESSETGIEKQIVEAVTDAIRKSDDKIVEIRPANGSSGRGRFPLLLLIGGAIAVGYWLRKSENPTEKLRSAASGTADRTKQMTEQAAETIQENGETVSERVEEKSQEVGERVQQTGETVGERVEEGSQRAGEEVQQTGENAAERTEQASESAAETTEQAGENAAEKADESGSDSSDGSSNS